MSVPEDILRKYKRAGKIARETRVEIEGFVREGMPVIEICEKVVGLGHKLCMTTNFSLPLKKIEALVDTCGQNLEYITASLHLSQISSIDEFVEKAIAFESIKNRETDFHVNSVVLEDNFEQLREIEEKLSKANVDFKYQIMKIRGKYAWVLTPT